MKKLSRKERDRRAEKRRAEAAQPNLFGDVPEPPPAPSRAPKRAYPTVADIQWIGANGKSTAYYGSRRVWAILRPGSLTPIYALVSSSDREVADCMRGHHGQGTKLRAVPLTPELAIAGLDLVFTTTAMSEASPAPVEVVDPPSRPDRAPSVPQDEPAESTPVERTRKPSKRSQAV